MYLEKHCEWTLTLARISSALLSESSILTQEILGAASKLALNIYQIYKSAKPNTDHALPEHLEQNINTGRASYEAGICQDRLVVYHMAIIRIIVQDFN